LVGNIHLISFPVFVQVAVKRYTSFLQPRTFPHSHNASDRSAPLCGEFRPYARGGIKDGLSNIGACDVRICTIIDSARIQLLEKPFFKWFDGRKEKNESAQNNCVPQEYFSSKALVSKIL